MTGALTIKNDGQAELKLTDRLRDSRSDSITEVLLNVEYQEYGTNGVMLTEKSQRSFQIGRDIVIASGETAEVPIIIDSVEFGEGSLNYRVYTVSATLFPAQFLLGSNALPGSVKFEPDSCEVFPRNFEHLQDNPLARLKEAVLKDSPTHLALAAALVKPKDRLQAQRVLLSILDSEMRTSSSLRMAACTALRITSGEDIGPDPERWKEWAREHRILETL
jgi:hypothetical protein